MVEYGRVWWSMVEYGRIVLSMDVNKAKESMTENGRAMALLSYQ